MRKGLLPLPESAEPYWFRHGAPLAGYQSNAVLPETADVVVIGAGLTGAAAAYHLTEAARAGRTRVVVLDGGDVAGEASGRNGGNFQLFPENSVGAYEGLAKERLDFLSRVYRGVPREILQAESDRQASLVLGIALRNRDLVKSIILRSQIDCDFAPRGWLHVACSDHEERGICEEVMLAARLGQRLEIWPRAKIHAELGLRTEYLGRFIPGDGTYHPYRYALGLMRAAVDAGVELYTKVPVQAVNTLHAHRHRVVTPRGTIDARRVIVATNAFTSRLFHELAAIRPRQSQIMLTEDAPDRTRGRAVTCNEGPIYMNQPRAGACDGRAPLLLGGGDDRPMRNPYSRRRSVHVHRLLLELRDQFFPELRGRPPSAEWVGAMGFTPDQLPAIGLLRPGVVVAAGFNGYGGSYTTAAGAAAAEMALEGTAPTWLPEDVFSPRRLLSDQPIFMAKQESLWRIAGSLSRQLRSVTQQIAETLSLRGNHAPPVLARKARRGAVRLKARSGAITPDHLKGLPGFEPFTGHELKRLASYMKRLEVTSESVLFNEGSAADSWYIVLEGSVSATVEVRGRQQPVAEFPRGSIVGQPSVIDGSPRLARCVLERGSVIAEVDRAASARLLRPGSETTLKLLGVISHGLVAALRHADQHLIQLNDDQGGSSLVMNGSSAPRD